MEPERTISLTEPTVCPDCGAAHTDGSDACISAYPVSGSIFFDETEDASDLLELPEDGSPLRFFPEENVEVSEETEMTVESDLPAWEPGRETLVIGHASASGFDGRIRQETDFGPSLATQVDLAVASHSSFQRKPQVKNAFRTAAMLVVAALAGAAAVYFLGRTEPPRPAVIQENGTSGEIGASTSEVFVSRPQSDVAPMQGVAETSEAEAQQDPRQWPHTAEQRPSRPAALRSNADVVSTGSAQNAAAAPDIDTSAAVPTTNSEKEANVAGMVIRKPTERKPLARCADGTYSYSASRSAACSGRGGVGEWLSGDKPATNSGAKNVAYILGPRGGCYYLDPSGRKIYVEKKYCT